jgi:hypothetical protein
LAGLGAGFVVGATDGRTFTISGGRTLINRCGRALVNRRAAVIRTGPGRRISVGRLSRICDGRLRAEARRRLDDVAWCVRLGNRRAAGIRQYGRLHRDVGFNISVRRRGFR